MEMSRRINRMDDSDEESLPAVEERTSLETVMDRYRDEEVSER